MKFTLSSGVLAMIVLGFAHSAYPQDEAPAKLFVREVPITVLGKKANVIAIEQEDGTLGFSPDETQGFHVEVINRLPVPTAIHWHGLILPNGMDGVPYVTQDPIAPGDSFVYRFPLKQSGSYWMHSHYGLQEQQLASAPMIIRSPSQSKVADTEFTVLLSDFSFKSPSEILKGLLGGMGGMPGMKDGAKKMEGMKGMEGMDMKEQFLVQQWDGARFVSKSVKASPPDIDIQYDALLANRRTLEDPEVFSVKPSQTVLLRIVAASSATNFLIDTGALEATIVATDGEDVERLSGNLFQICVGQRLDLLLTVPKEGGAFPVLALGEGTNLQAGVILATNGVALPKLAVRGNQKAGGLDNTQELRLVASEPLAPRSVDNSLPSLLGGSMADYSWTINGAAYPNRDSLKVTAGQRIEIVMKNETGMSHPMHLHGHVFQVTEIDGTPVRGAKRDTVLVPAKSTIKIQFDADNPGIWACHCHIIYHIARGMFTVLQYEGADGRFWTPDKSPTELEYPLNSDS